MRKAAFAVTVGGQAVAFAVLGGDVLFPIVATIGAGTALLVHWVMT